MIMSSTRCSSSSPAGAFVDDRALAHDEHPVGEPEHLGHLAGDEQRRPPPRRPAGGSARRSPSGRRRRRRGSARRAAAPAAAEQPAGEHDLLLVAAGQRAGQPGRVRGRTSSDAVARAPPRFPPAVHPAEPGENRGSEASETLRTTDSPSSSAWLLRSSGASPSPGAHGGRRRGPPAASCRRRSPSPTYAGGRRRPSRAPRSGRRRPGRRGRRSRLRARRTTRRRSARQREVGDDEQQVARGGRLRSRRERVLDGAAGHQGHDVRVGVVRAGSPVATVRPSLSTVTRSPIVRISSSRCEM